MRVAIFALLFLVTTCCAQAQPKVDHITGDLTPTLTKVGALLSLTGPLSSVGTPIRQGMELALSEQKINRWKLIVEDDKSVDRVASVTATNRLISVDKVDLLLVEAMSAVSAIATIVDRNQLPTIVVWDSNLAVARSGKFLFGFGFSNELAGTQMAEYARGTLGAHHITVIKAQNDWSELIARAFVERAKALGGSIVMDETVNGDNTDFRTLIVKAKQQDAKAIYAPLWGAGLRALIRQARELQFQGALLTGDGLTDEDLRELGASADGLLATQAWLENNDFQRRYEKRFKNDASASGVNLGYAALGYDVMGMVIALCNDIESNGRSISKKTIQSALPKFRYTGVLGEISFSGEHLSGRKESLLVVKNGKFELAQ